MNAKQKYASLVKAHAPDLYRYAYWLSGSHEIAEDLLQETHARAWKNLKQLRDDASSKAWLITILRRENARRFERKQLEIVESEEEDWIENNAKDPFIEFQHTQLRLLILKLDEKYREPLALQIILGLSCEEIAQQLSISPNAVMTRLFRAKHMLKDAMQNQEIPQQRNTP